MEKQEYLEEFIKEYLLRKGKVEEDKLFFYLDYAIRSENPKSKRRFRAMDADDRLNRVRKLLNSTD